MWVVVVPVLVVTCLAELPNKFPMGGISYTKVVVGLGYPAPGGPTTTTVPWGTPGDTVQASQTAQDGDFEMPVTEELIAFFEHSARHRKSLGNSRDKHQWPQAPTPVSCRRHVQLYGPAAAASVRGMEIAMQLSFEHFTDSQQPKPWPNIPLKL
ncbi:hypothetical protein HPB50_001573 [Hyalomma asiaticum]|uniref:Uncharacterized protein n=1 Tax=Hyalomma asiaticum TaxID=266040 RepID=A0ACB7SLD3_HYAAI|nr:hypothetical protein HPB50_001573 [Hyalomma asiaticum]